MKLSNVKKLLIVRLSSLGDILLTTPLIRSIKKKYPDIEIDFVLREEFHNLLKLNPYIRNIYLYPKAKEKLKNLKKYIYKNNYDLVIDLQNNFLSRRLLKHFGGSVTRFKKKNLYKFLLVQFKINKLKDAPPIPVRYANVIENFELDDEGLDLITNNEPSKLLRENDNLIGLCPGSKHYTKMWPKDYFIQLGNLLMENNYKVLIFGGTEDIRLCEDIASNISSSVNLCNENDILQTAADMKMCRAIYCNDSGLMHTASAMKVPVMVFFGSTVGEFGFSPYNSKNLILENNNLSCRPCSHIGKSKCPKGHFKCMKEISPQMAFDNLEMLIN